MTNEANRTSKTTPVEELRYLAFRAKTVGDSTDADDIAHCLIPAILRRLGLTPMSLSEHDAHRAKILKGKS